MQATIAVTHRQEHQHHGVAAMLLQLLPGSK